MNLLRKRNWFICLLLNILTLGAFNLVLANFLNLYSKDAWYKKWQYWFFGGICLIFPIFILLLVFIVQMICSVADALNVPGSDLYNSPYTWIICIIVPVIGWILLLVMLIYIMVFSIVMIYQGEGEKYLSE